MATVGARPQCCGLSLSSLMRGTGPERPRRRTPISRTLWATPPCPTPASRRTVWVSQDGFMSFRADAPGRIDLHLMVPGGIGIAKDDVTFTVDGGDKTTQALALGDSIVALPVTAGNAQDRLAFRHDRRATQRRRPQRRRLAEVDLVRSRGQSGTGRSISALMRASKAPILHVNCL